jgi:hypothetical protein
MPDLLLAHGGGITLVGPGTAWLTGAAVATAYPDLRGGVLFQRAGEPPGPIEHLAAPGAAPAVLVSSAPRERLAIIDVFYDDGEPTLAYSHGTRLPNDCPADDVECGWDYDVTYLMVMNLASATSTNLGTVGAFESDWHAFRFGAGVYAAMWSEYAEEAVCVGWGPIGELLVAATPGRWLSARDRCRLGPPRECPDDPLCSGVTRLDVAADGSRLAFVVGGHLRPTNLVEVDIESGQVVRSHELSGLEVLPAWIAYDGSWTVLGRLAADWSELPSVVVRPDGVVEELEVAGRVTFWDPGPMR